MQWATVHAASQGLDWRRKQADSLRVLEWAENCSVARVYNSWMQPVNVYVETIKVRDTGSIFTIEAQTIDGENANQKEGRTTLVLVETAGHATTMVEKLKEEQADAKAWLEISKRRKFSHVRFIGQEDHVVWSDF